MELAWCSYMTQAEYEQAVKKFSDLKEEIDKWEDEIALGLRNLCYIFNPSLIVLGGGIMSEDMLIKDINEKVQAQLEPNYKHVRIVKAQLRNKAGMLGAAWLASERLKNWNK